MRRRTFVTGSLLGAGLLSSQDLRSIRSIRSAAEPSQNVVLDDGRSLVRGAATAFGTTVSIAVVHGDAELARRAISRALSEVQLIDRIMSLYSAESQVSILNRTGRLDKPHPHLVRNLEFSQALASQTGGAFDITVQPLWELFWQSKQAGLLPSVDAISRARHRVHWQAIDVSSYRIAFERQKMAITLNGVAQGYATDVAYGMLRNDGVTDAMIDTGEFGSLGARQPAQPWTLGLQHPRDAHALIAVARMDGRFFSTSGDYATMFSDDFLYHHIFDPATGVSPTTFSSTIVVAESGMIADGLSTALMVLDAPRGKALLARYDRADALWIDKECQVDSTPGMPLV